MTIKKGTSTIATTGSTTWGGLEGTLSDQTDLQNALDAKASTLSPAFSGIPTAPTAQEGTNTTQIATTAFVKAAVDNIDALPDQTDMSGKYLATDGVNAFWKSPAGLPLLSHIWSDHLLNDASFLRADTFSWQNGNVYKSAYEHLVDDIDGITATTETIGSYTITYYPCTDGHKIVLANQETTVMNIYDETGIAWYYILDTANTRFKLPRTKWGFVGYRDSVGKYVAESLPNITASGINSEAAWTANMQNVTGAWSIFHSGQSSITGSGTNPDFSFAYYDLDASRSSSAYQNNAPVQQRATQMYLYFYVGNFVRNETEIDVGEITEALDGKLDQDLSNASAGFKRRVSDYSAPSDQYIDYTFPSTNGDTETAPANGWFVLQSGVNAGGYLGLRNLTNGISFEVRYSSATNGRTFVPCATGDTIEVGFEQLVSSNQLFRFVYAEGEI